MKTKIVASVLFLISTIGLNAQCPGEKAIAYKKKAQADIQNASAYVNLAAYYVYKCECENGTNREAELIKAISYLVDVNSSYTNNQFEKIYKVTKCKKIGDIDSTMQNSTNGGQVSSGAGSGLGFPRELENILSSTLGADAELTQAFKNYNIGNDFGNKLISGNANSDDIASFASHALGEDSGVAKSLQSYAAGENLGNALASGNVTGNDLAGFASNAFGEDSGVAKSLQSYATGENLGNALVSGNATDLLSSGLQVLSLFGNNEKAQEETPEEREERERIRKEIEEAKEKANKFKMEYRKTQKENLKKLKEEKTFGGFSSGLQVKKSKRGWFGYINEKGDWVIKPKYLSAESFINGTARVITKMGKIKYIDTNNKTIKQ